MRVFHAPTQAAARRCRKVPLICEEGHLDEARSALALLIQMTIAGNQVRGAFTYHIQIRCPDIVSELKAVELNIRTSVGSIYRRTNRRR